MKAIFLLQTAILVSMFATKVAAFSSQAGTCDISGVPTPLMSGSTVGSGPDSRFSVAISPNPIVRGQAHTIMVVRTSGMGGFRGVLLYVEDARDPKVRIGSLGASNGVLVQGLGCPQNEQPTSTLTHTSSSTFTDNQAFIWNAPQDISGPITINVIAYEANTQFNVPTPLVVPLAPTPPQVVNVNTDEDTGNGTLSNQEQTSAAITQIIVSLDQEVVDGAGNTDVNDVTNPENYLLVQPGLDESFNTASCALGLEGDDVQIPVNSVNYDSNSNTSTLQINGAVPLGLGDYQLLVCGSTSIENAAGQKLDGDADGTGGDDFLINFSVIEPGAECDFIVIPSGSSGGAVVCI